MADPEIKSGHLNDQSHSIQPSHLQLTVRCLILAAWIAGLDAAAIQWAADSREGIPGAGAARVTHFGGLASDMMGL